MKTSAGIRAKLSQYPPNIFRARGQSLCFNPQECGGQDSIFTWTVTKQENPAEMLGEVTQVSSVGDLTTAPS